MELSFWHPYGRLLHGLRNWRPARKSAPVRKPAPVLYIGPAKFIVPPTIRGRLDVLRRFFHENLHCLGEYRLVLHLTKVGAAGDVMVDLGRPKILVVDRESLAANIRASPFDARECLAVRGISLLNPDGLVVGGGPTGICQWVGGTVHMNDGDTLHMEFTLTATEELR